MSIQSTYKNQKQRRTAVVETDYSMGMMYSEGALDKGYLKTLVNYDFNADGSINPRPCIHTDTLVLPNTDYWECPEELDEPKLNRVCDYKRCIENSVTHDQVIIGDSTGSKKGNIGIYTYRIMDNADVALDSEAGDNTEIHLGEGSFGSKITHPCNMDVVYYEDIHGVRAPSVPRCTPVGCFSTVNNSYYFMSDTFNRTVYDSATESYNVETISPKEISASEAVTYGYNMLLNNPYVFQDMVGGSNIMQFNGILPYSVSGELLMTPKTNENIWFRVYYDVPATTDTYKIIWEWREVSTSSWTEIQTSEVTFTDMPELTASFKPPVENIIVRVQAFPIDGTTDPILEKAIAVGFDFSKKERGTISNLDPVKYDLKTATGMISWKGRLILWGVESDPTILFLSELNTPSYFPYPNNIVVLDEPIIKAVPFMDDLIVFTTSKAYQIKYAEDGLSWTSTVVQSNLSIQPWDKHFIQVIRNMLYFKSGDYFYMIVPKAQTLTGELTLAPITTPITSLFNNFLKSVTDIIKDTYKKEELELSLKECFNFLSYESIHNVYAFNIIDSEFKPYVYFDVVYNTNTRRWSINVFEHDSLLYPYDTDNTQMGRLASVARRTFKDEDSTAVRTKFVFELCAYDTSFAIDFRIPDNFLFPYSETPSGVYVNNTTVYTKKGFTVDGVTVKTTSSYAYYTYRDKKITIKSSAESYFSIYSKPDIIESLRAFYNDPGTYSTFRNLQFLDTGYRKDNTQLNKKYREVQIQLNSLDKSDINCGVDFFIDGERRKVIYAYDPSQYIDETNPEYGIIYLDSTPFLDVPIDSIDQSNTWTIDQGLNSDVNFWRVRIPISGKGVAPRMKIYSLSEKRFQLVAMNWIYRMMNMR